MAVRDHLDLFETVPDSTLDAMVEAAADPESPLAFAELRHWGGAMARPSPDAGPVGQAGLGQAAPVALAPVAALPPAAGQPGRMLWLRWKTLSGSQTRLRPARRR